MFDSCRCASFYSSYCDICNIVASFTFAVFAAGQVCGRVYFMFNSDLFSLCRLLNGLFETVATRHGERTSPIMCGRMFFHHFACGCTLCVTLATRGCSASLLVFMLFARCSHVLLVSRRKLSPFAVRHSLVRYVESRRVTARKCRFSLNCSDGHTESCAMSIASSVDLLRLPFFLFQAALRHEANNYLDATASATVAAGYFNQVQCIPGPFRYSEPRSGREMSRGILFANRS